LEIVCGKYVVSGRAIPGTRKQTDLNITLQPRLWRCDWAILPEQLCVALILCFVRSDYIQGRQSHDDTQILAQICARSNSRKSGKSWDNGSRLFDEVLSNSVANLIRLIILLRPIESTIITIQDRISMTPFPRALMSTTDLMHESNRINERS
jgi:hypothetical protein